MKKILIVDDEPAILTLLQYNLEAEHYQVETATDGQEALDKVRSEPFDFIIRLVKLRLILKIIKLAKPDTDCN